MEYKTIGNIKTSVLGIGTVGMGLDREEDKKNISAIRTAVDLGMTHIDTAEAYSNGKSEELVGKAIKVTERRKLFITTKVSKDNLSYHKLISSAEKSLKRLGIKYIDLYLIHWPNPKISLKETMSAMDFLVDQGLVRNIGVSNFSIKLMKEVRKFSKNISAASFHRTTTNLPH